MGRIHITLSTRPRPQLSGPDQASPQFSRLKAALTLFLFVSVLIGLLIAAIVLGSIIAVFVLIVVAVAVVVLLVKRTLRLRRPP